MSKPIALITGASAGIGAELAREFASHGYDLVIAARREPLLKSLADELGDQSMVYPVAVDLAKIAGPQRLFDAVADLGLEVDVLVNNAGVADIGQMFEARRKSLIKLVDLNVRALTDLTYRFGALMVERGYGHILNVASIASFQPVPGMAVYAASKAFVLSLTESLSEELRGTGVTITALCPGLTRTEMAVLADETEVIRWLVADAKSVAKQGFDACQMRQVIRVPGIANQALVSWSRFQPRWLARTLLGLASRASPLLK
jgi:short-subunit dehydrogenase